MYQRALRKLGVPNVARPLNQASDRKKVDQQALKVALPLLPSAIFLQVQGVVTVFLVFAVRQSTELLAQVGAFSRLAMVLTVVDRVTGVLLFPALARAPAGPRLLAIVLRVHVAYMGAMALMLLSAWFGGHWWILLLAASTSTARMWSSYVWMVFLATILLNASNFAFRTLAVRGLTAKQSYSVPVVLTVQILYLWLFGVSDLVSVLGFGIATSLANFVVQYALLGARFMAHLRGG